MAEKKPVLEKRQKVEITNRRESDIAKVYVGVIVNEKFLSERFEVGEPVEMYPSQIKSLEGRQEMVRQIDKKTKNNYLVQKSIYTISKV